MRWLIVAGVILIVLGVAGLAYHAIPIHHTEQAAKIGSLIANRDAEDNLVISTLAAVISIVAGGLLVAAGRRFPI